MQGMQDEEYGKGSLNDYIQALAAALGALFNPCRRRRRVLTAGNDCWQELAMG